MGKTLESNFTTRRDAEAVIERLVQEFSIERTDIFVSAEGAENTSGEVAAGSDLQPAQPSPEPRSDAPLRGAINLSVDLQDDGLADKVRSVFEEFNGSRR